MASNKTVIAVIAVVAVIIVVACAAYYLTKDNGEGDTAPVYYRDLPDRPDGVYDYSLKYIYPDGTYEFRVSLTYIDGEIVSGSFDDQVLTQDQFDAYRIADNEVYPYAKIQYDGTWTNGTETTEVYKALFATGEAIMSEDGYELYVGLIRDGVSTQWSLIGWGEV